MDSCCGGNYRFSISSTTADGRRVMRIFIAGNWPVARMFNLLSMACNTKAISAMAKLLPIHMRGPAPKGKKGLYFSICRFHQ